MSARRIITRHPISSPGCELHKTHRPPNLTVEVHHIIPVAWQLFWQPQVAPYPGKDPDGRGNLWDARTVTCCPTGHRNIHFWIVKLMHAVKPGGTAIYAAYAVNGPKANVQYEWACEALQRYEEAGGSLQKLVEAGEWGEA